MAALVLGGGIGIMRSGYTSSGMVVALGVAVVGLMVPDLIALHDRQKAKRSHLLGLPDALDMLVVCVEAGLVSTKPCVKYATN
jgi:tight adherence protein C